MNDAINRIARETLYFETLERRWSDSLDFRECATWQIKEALEAAYRAGFEAAKSEKKRRGNRRNPLDKPCD